MCKYLQDCLIRLVDLSILLLLFYNLLYNFGYNLSKLYLLSNDCGPICSFTSSISFLANWLSELVFRAVWHWSEEFGHTNGVTIVKTFPVLKEYTLFYTVVDVFCIIGCLNFTHIQLLILRYHFLKHIQSIQLVSPLQAISNCLLLSYYLPEGSPMIVFLSVFLTS